MTRNGIDPDIAQYVEAMDPDSASQRVAMENTLQARRVERILARSRRPRRMWSVEGVYRNGMFVHWKVGSLTPHEDDGIPPLEMVITGVALTMWGARRQAARAARRAQTDEDNR